MADGNEFKRRHARGTPKEIDLPLDAVAPDLKTIQEDVGSIGLALHEVSGDPNRRGLSCDRESGFAGIFRPWWAAACRQE